MTPTTDRVGALVTALGECPIWDPQRRRLWLLDCRVGHIHSIDLATGVGALQTVPAPAGSMALNRDGRLIVALKEEVVLLDPERGTLRSLGRIDDQHPNLRLNDGAAMPDGSFVVGTMHVFRDEGEAPLGGLYRLDPQGHFRRIAQGFGIVNGPVMHPWNGRLHVCDSAARSLYSYAMDADGSLHDSRLFAQTKALGSAPDGCCFDRDGGLWTALVHAGAIVRFDAEGGMTHRVNLPVAHPASLCFAGEALDQIVVTTISDSGRLRGSGPLDGAVLCVRDLGFQGAERPQCNITPKD
ncbi:MAG: SMP-30/gluconolactonase/LRE family protein [Hydrogenophaga sp.]|nr:SMP-30/gluconolactonase/LRE family protein [Hydrogenophaga sp.]